MSIKSKVIHDDVNEKKKSDTYEYPFVFFRSQWCMNMIDRQRHEHNDIQGNKNQRVYTRTFVL